MYIIHYQFMIIKMENLFTLEEKTLLTISFAQLKPACDQLITNPSMQNVNQLLRVLSETPPQAIQKLTHYILLPIELHLHNNSLKWELKLYLLQCMKLVLQKSSLDDLKKIQNLYILLFGLISHKNESEKLFMSSEEFLIEVLECVTVLMTSAGVAEFYRLETHAQLSFGVYKCVLITRNIQASLVQSKSFNCLLALTQTHNDCQSKPDKQQLVELVRKILPGIVSCCGQTISVGALQHHSVMIGAVRTWSKVICLVMEDTDIGDNISIDTVRAACEGQLVLKPCDEWTSMADAKLKSTTDIITAARNHPHWRVRLEITCACRDVLNTCRRHMASSVNALLETLIILSQDDMTEVSTLASQNLQMLFQADNNCLLENLLQENLFELLQKLSCIIDTNDETKQVSCLHLLKGYLLCLGKQRLPQLLMSSVYLEQLFSTLITIVELETSHITLLDNAAMKDFDHVKRQDTPWKVLRHFTDTKLMLSKVEAICCVLGQCCHVIVLVQYLLDIFESQLPNRKEICVLLSYILKHSSRVNSEEKQSLVNSILETVLNTKVWHLQLSLRTDPYSGHAADNAGHARSNTALACLLCDVLASAAVCLGNEFRQCLFQSLYVLIERAGSQHEFLSLAGLQAIQTIAEVCCYASVAQLISDNIDYLSYHMTQQLKQGTPLVLDAIKVILQQANEKVLPCIEDILEHALREGPVMFTDENKKLSHLNMYLVFVTKIREWHCQNMNTYCQTLDPPVDYVKDLLEYEKLKYMSENYENETEWTEQEEERFVNENQEEPDENETKTTLDYIRMIEAILTTSLHFLPSRTLNHQVLVLQILNEGLRILATHDENVLLPLVHKVWSPLVSRLQDTAHPLVLNHAFNLLLTLAITSKDFIRSRTIKEVIPSLIEFLRESANESKLKDAGSAYRLTYKYKLQLSLLSHLNEVILALGLREKVTHQLLSTVSVYLSNQQPAPLQKATVELFQHILKNEVLRCVAWTLLMCLWPEKPLFKSSKPSIFRTYCAQEGQPVYKKNVIQLYEYFHQHSPR